MYTFFDVTQSDLISRLVGIQWSTLFSRD